MRRIMKKLFFIIILLAFVLSNNSEIKAQPYQRAEFGVFYSALAPYGTWIEINGGLTVWRPYNVRAGWIPYTVGQWIWTADGWYWNSYEPFGYIVFHYGRWYYDDYYGWIWTPDYNWAPAWVQWRYDNNYIGWAPLPPYARFSPNVGIYFSINFFTPYRYWSFVRYRYFYNPHVYNYYEPLKIKYRIFFRTHYRTNYGYFNGRIINRGVNIDYISQKSGRRIIERKIERVHNTRRFLRNRNGNRSINVARAFIPSRKQIVRSERTNIVVRRGKRRSTMDVSGLKINSGRNAGRSIPGILRNDRPRNDRAQRDFNRIGNNSAKSNRSGFNREFYPQRNNRPDIGRNNKRIEKTVPNERKQIHSRQNEFQRNREGRKNFRNNPPRMKRDSKGNRNDRNRGHIIRR